jgi:malonyl-CoA O-methyltransferase
MAMTPAGFDSVQVRRAFDRAAGTYERSAVVAREVERRMAEKLHYLRITPTRVLDAGSGTGTAHAVLRARYPGVDLIEVDISTAMLRAARSRRGLGERLRALAGAPSRHWLCGDYSRLPLRNAIVQMVWSSLALAWSDAPLAALAEFHRVLAPGGALMFSTYGPDTLKELRQAFAAMDAAPHVHSFVDMHDLGDMLVAAGFDAPVMEMERISVTYPDVDALARDLKFSGQSSAWAARRRGLTTPRAWQRLRDQYEKQRQAGRLPVSVEVVYGHAWRGERTVSEDGRQIVQFQRGR